MGIGSGVPATKNPWSKVYNGHTTAYVVFSSISAACGGLVFGYDIGISGGVISMRSFLRKFFPHILDKLGTGNNYCKFNDQKLQAFTSSLYIAGLIATFAAGYTSRKWGRIFTMRIAALCIVVGTVLCTAAPALSMLIAGRIVLGVGVGFGNQAIPLYLSEMAPMHIRGRLNNLFQLMISIGIFIANLVNFGTNKIDGWGWRLALGGTGVPAALLTLGSIFLVDTPNSLIERGQYDEGKRVLQKIRGVEDVDAEYADICTASELAKKVKHPYKNIASRKARPQLVISTLLQVFQQFTGINVIMFYSPVLFQTLGFGSNASLYSAVITGVFNVLCTLVAVLCVDKFGRRKLLLQGGGQMLLAMACISGILGAQLPLHGTLPSSSAMVVVCFICLFVAGFAWSWGPAGWLIPSELFPLETRSAGQSICVSTNLLFTFMIAQCFLSMLCSMKYTIFIFFLVWIVVMTFCVYFFLPETKGVPIEEMKHLWGQHWYWKRFISESEVVEEETRARKDVQMRNVPWDEILSPNADDSISPV